jgi:hypothetical protein
LRQRYRIAGEIFQPGEIVLARVLDPHELECQGPGPSIPPFGAEVIGVKNLWDKSVNCNCGNRFGDHTDNCHVLTDQFEYGHQQLVTIKDIDGEIVTVSGVYFTANCPELATSYLQTRI